MLRLFRLRSSFFSSETDFTTVEVPNMNATSLQNSQLKDIYAFNLLRSSSLKMSSSESYLISRLVDIESKLCSGHRDILGFAKQVLDAYEMSESHFDVARVCLAYNPPLSRKLLILSAANVSEDGPADLVPGYYCYVSPYSSLFAYTPSNHNGKVRTYSNIDSVIQSFLEAARPVQRTIGKLHEAGLRSGMSIAIDLGRLGNAMLFLNSKKIGAFDQFQGTDFLSTCVLRLVTSAAIQRILTPPDPFQLAINLQIENLHIKNVFCVRRFSEALSALVGNLFRSKVSINIIDSAAGNFFLPTQTILLLVLNLLRSHAEQSEIDYLMVSIFTSSEKNSTLEISFDVGASFSRNEAAIAYFKAFASTANLVLNVFDRGFSIESPCQIASEQEIACDYSVFSGKTGSTY
jgi:hypothetical protein